MVIDLRIFFLSFAFACTITVLQAQLLEDRGRLKFSEGEKGKSLFKKRIKEKEPKKVSRRQKTNVIVRYTKDRKPNGSVYLRNESVKPGFVTGGGAYAPSISGPFITGRSAPFPSDRSGFVTGKGAPIPSDRSGFVTGKGPSPRYSSHDNSPQRLQNQPRFTVFDSKERSKKMDRFSPITEAQGDFYYKQGLVHKQTKKKDLKYMHSQNDQNRVESSLSLHGMSKKEKKNKSEENALKQSKYMGAIQVKDAVTKKEEAKERGKVLSVWKTNYKPFKEIHPDAYPDHVYHETQQIQKKFWRNMVKRINVLSFKLNKNQIQPESVKKKPGKLRYDKEEADIWVK